jgi:hypothetical protein
MSNKRHQSEKRSCWPQRDKRKHTSPRPPKTKNKTKQNKKKEKGKTEKE